MLTTATILLRILATVIMCGLIGLEREVHGKPIGFRTAALVGLGSAIMTICGIYFYYLFPGSAADPSRIASLVVSGIGFLGAGVIIQSRGAIHGITTAASLWTVAGLGIAFGMGLFTVGIISGAIAFAILWGLYILDRKYLHNHKSNYPENQ